MDKYEEIKTYILSESMKRGVNTRMPSVRELMRRFAVSQSPVQRAVRELREGGLLYCRPGRGIVCAGKLQENLTPGRILSHREERPNILYAAIDFFSENLWCMEHEIQLCALREKFNLIHFKIQQNTSLLELFKELDQIHDFAGIILVAGSTVLDFRILDWLGTRKYPVIFLNNNFNYKDLGDNIATVTWDGVQTGTLIGQFLASKGHSCYGYVRNEPQLDIQQESFVALKREAARNNAECHYFSCKIVAWENSSDSAIRIVERNIAKIREKKITALVFSSSNGAFASLAVFRRRHVQIPEELGIMGFGDSNIARYNTPPLTVISSDHAEKMRLAVGLVNGTVEWRRENKLQTRITDRGSIGIIP